MCRILSDHTICSENTRLFHVMPQITRLLCFVFEYLSIFSLTPLGCSYVSDVVSHCGKWEKGGMVSAIPEIHLNLSANISRGFHGRVRTNGTHLNHESDLPPGQAIGSLVLQVYI